MFEIKSILSGKYTALFFIGAAVLLRFFSFIPSVLDHDESTYLIIGRDILNGKDLYTDVTDTKPVGIFVFYAALEFLFGGSIFLKRLVFALIVGITAFLVYKVSLRMFAKNKVAFASGLIYIIYTSVWTYHGRSPNTELLFNLTTISALLVFLKPKTITFILGGLLMGIGFIIKYLVLFDMAAFLLFFFLFDLIRDSKIIRQPVFWRRYILSGVAFLVPFGLVNLYFWMGNHFHDFFYITYELPGNYGSSPSLKRYFTMLLDFIAKFLPISFLAFYVIFKRKKPLEKRFKWLFALWIAGILVAIYLPGKEFSHYTIQLMLPVSLLAGLFFHPDFHPDRYSAVVFSGKTGRVLFFSAIIVIQSISFEHEVLRPDYPRQVAALIQEKLDDGEVVFVSDYEQIVYYLLEIDSPTKFVHSNLLFTETHKAFNVNAGEELKRIMKNSPEFVVVEREHEKIQPLMGIKYRLIHQLEQGKIRLYELR